MVDLIKEHIWLILFLIWGFPLSYYRSNFRKIVYQTDDWKINIQPLFIKEIRGKGLWIGVEFNQKISAKKVCLSLMNEGILAKETHETVIRFAPPLTITKEEIDWAMEKIIKVLGENQ